MLHAVLVGDGEKTKELASRKRWLATVQYIDKSTSRIPFDEFSDLGGIIEGGPDWNLIEHIHVTLTQKSFIGQEYDPDPSF
jgi:hypothetical protein